MDILRIWKGLIFRKKTVDTRYKTQDKRHKIRDTRYKTQDMRHKI